MEFQLSEIKEPSKLTLTVRVAGTNVCNRWNFWVYPSLLDLPSEKPYVTSDFNDAIAHAKAGRNVLYCLSKTALKEDKGGAIKVGFLLFSGTRHGPESKHRIHLVSIVIRHILFLMLFQMTDIATTNGGI